MTSYTAITASKCVSMTWRKMYVRPSIEEAKRLARQGADADRAHSRIVDELTSEQEERVRRLETDRVRPGGCCLPRHPTHIEPSLLELHGTL
jgi:hypothetical protein